MWTTGDNYKIILFYRYVKVDDVSLLMSQLREKCETLGLLGRILVSTEGINGTLAGSIPDVDSFVEMMSQDIRFSKVDWKETPGKGENLPFLGLSIRQVDEIISCGERKRFINQNIQFEQNTFGGIVGTGEHLTPAQFHEAMSTNPNEYILLDVRNEFEYDIGHFENATKISTVSYAETFKVFDDIFEKQQREQHQAAEESLKQHQETDSAPIDGKNTNGKILMYCTGGIRCEKASAYLRAMGHDQVYQLQGGIHRYLEAYPDGGKFLGKNFVFDSRVSVGPTASYGDTDTADADSSGAATSCCDKVVVVGKCIDCACAHDEYSGYVVCTVCRQPVLVCPNCRNNNPHPEEYYCHRHRDLKNIYFTILTPYSMEELLLQKEALKKCLDDCLVISAKEKGHKQVARIAVDTYQLEKEEVPLPEKMQITSRNRRRTLRRQIVRIEDRLKELFVQQQQQQQQAEVVKTTILTQEQTQQENKPLIQHNPKNKGGWGFWRT